MSRPKLYAAVEIPGLENPKTLGRPGSQLIHGETDNVAVGVDVTVPPVELG
jgi:hypothetical protein